MTNTDDLSLEGSLFFATREVVDVARIDAHLCQYQHPRGGVTWRPAPG